MATKYYLDQPGLERLVEYINNALASKANVGDIAVLPDDIVRQADLDVFALKEDLDNLDINGFATDADIERLEGLINGVYHFRGSVADLTELQQIEDPQVGDVYNLADTGMNAAWTGEAWDEFGSIVDLSDYLTEEEVQAIDMPTLNAILYGGPRAVVFDKAGVEAMIANDEPEVEIVLSGDLAVSTPIEIPEGKEVTLDLGGKTLSGARPLAVDGGTLTLKNGTIETTGYAVTATNGAEVIVDGANIDSTNMGITASNGATVTVNSGEITAQEVGVLGVKDSTVVINGGVFESWDNFPIGGNGSAAGSANDGTNANFVMNGGQIIAHIQSNGYIAAGVYVPNSGSFTMNGGEIISDGAGLVMRGGQVNLNGGSIIANGATGVKGKVGDSRVVVGPYAVVYDAQSRYPAVDTLELNIAEGMILQGTDGDIDYVLEAGREANVNDNR